MPRRRYDSISVLVPTCDRAAVLRDTLANFVRLDRTAIEVEFVIIDNNSTDGTKRVIESFSDRLPLRYLFQHRPGKNAALNLALNRGGLGNLLVFTDDDVLPRSDWLIQIALVSRRQPRYDVFGGKTYIIWPVDPAPAWATSPGVIGWGFGSNEDIGEFEGPYPAGRYPVGFNYWVRNHAIGDARFDEALGPVPEGRILGDETTFLMGLAQAGHQILYSSRAVVGHRIQPESLTLRAMRRRAQSAGRSDPYVSGLCRRELWDRHPFLWRLLRAASLLRYSTGYLVASFHPNRDKAIELKIRAARELAAGLQMLRVAGRLPAPPPAAPRPGQREKASTR